MPGKHKNKDKAEQRQTSDAIITPSDIPTSAQIDVAFKESQVIIDRSLKYQKSGVDMIQYLPVHAIGANTETHRVHGPLGSYEADRDISVSFEGDFTTQCAMVDMNNKLRYRPQRVQPVPREAALKYYTSYPIKDHVQSLPPAVTTIISVGGEPLWTSTKEVADTEEILVKDLLWPKRHVGRSILCRVLTRCRVHEGLSFLVEDTQSVVISVTIKHPFPFPAIVYSPSDVQSLWPIGTCLYIKEPYVRMGNRGGVEILVAWPKDLVEVPRVAGVFDHPAVQSATNDLGMYRLAAAVAFAQNKVKLAVRLASIGLTLASLPHIHNKTDENDSHNLALLVGRALAYWLNGQPGAAYSDCLKAEYMLEETTSSRTVEPLSRRIALIRLQAAYKLRMFEVASRHLVECQNVGVHSSILHIYREAITRRNEESKGQFVSTRGPSSLGSDRALYMGPIKVVVDPIKGRTVVTTRPVKSGELLLAEKPTVGLGYNGSPGVTSLTERWGMLALKPSPHTVSWTVHQISDDPSIGQCVHSLVPTADIEDGNLGITDEERLAVFRDPCEIELDLLDRQICRNSFGAEGTLTLYGLGSMISHSCKTNLAGCDSDGISYQRAVNDMAEGEELVKSYINPRRSFESRHTALLRNWFFDCDCTLCKADKRAGDQHQLRAKIMSDEWPALEAEAKSCTRGIVTASAVPSAKVKSIITRLEQFASRIDGTYAPGRSGKWDLSDVHFALADLWASHSASESLRYYGTGFKNIEWELHTVQEMRTTRRAIRRYGYTETDVSWTHTRRLKAMESLYRLEKLTHAASAMAESITAFAGLRISPVTDAAAVSGRPFGLDTGQMIDGWATPKPGEAPQGRLSQEQLKNMHKIVTLPSGEKVQVIDLKGTPFEGHEEECMRQFQEFSKKLDALDARGHSF